uniref:Uncharacterized protein n=1 Tax=Arundo donax TaxID=35708 RepID=A0A0A9BI29_ARUDO
MCHRKISRHSSNACCSCLQNV